MDGMTGDIGRFLFDASTWVVPVMMAIILHEVAHGYVANMLGDPTARLAHRLTLNPFRHVDRMGTVIVPGLLFLLQAPFLFGWAKPVPVDFRRLRNPRRDMVLVALAGPGTNLGLAVVAAVGLAVAMPEDGTASLTRFWIVDTLSKLLILNLVLAVFNMIPLPPLDGGRVAVGLLPAPLAMRLARLERVGLLLLIGLLFLLPLLGSQIGIDLDIFRWVVGVPVGVLRDLLLHMVGIATP
jgi:Zn-dependent protease